MNADSEQMRVVYEGAVKLNPSDIEAVQYLAVWHLERHSFQQARKYFGHLATLKQFDADVWLCLSVCCAMAEEFSECATALKTAQNLIPQSEEDIRVKFCNALMSEKRKDYTIAMEGYVTCLNQCAAAQNQPADETTNANNTNGTGGAASNEQGGNWPAGDATSSASGGQGSASAGTGTGPQKLVFMKELRGEVMLRIAVLKKEMGAIDQSMQMCNSITTEAFGDSIRANALCLKGLLHEMRAEFPASEVVYRSVLQITSGHSTALERLGRVYLRYRETIPAAVQCFFKSVETNPSNHVAWYLLGRCYMATSQYSDACEAYNRAVNLNPNDPQVWCSLGVLYYAFGQYREALGMLARALKLDSTMADAWYNVGALYDMCDQPEDAQQAYMKAKENGLADRFARAGMGLNPLAMQSLQFINSTSASNSAAAAVNAATTATAPAAAAPSSSSSNNHNNSNITAVAPNPAPVESAPPSAPVASVAPVHNVQAAAPSNANKTASAARKQQLQQQQLLHQQQALQQHQLQQQQQQMQMKQLQIQQQQLYQQQQAQQHRALQYQQQQQQALQQQILQQQQMNLPPEQAAQLQQHLQQLQYQQQMHQLQNQQQQIHYQQQQLQQHGASVDHSQQGGNQSAHQSGHQSSHQAAHQSGQHGSQQGQNNSHSHGAIQGHAQQQHPHSQPYYDMQQHGATAEQLQALQQQLQQQQQQQQQALQGRAQDPATPQHNNGLYGTSLMDNPTGF